jgi:hypothetical protein
LLQWKHLRLALLVLVIVVTALLLGWNDAATFLEW